MIISRGWAVAWGRGRNTGSSSTRRSSVVAIALGVCISVASLACSDNDDSGVAPTAGAGGDGAGGLSATGGLGGIGGSGDTGGAGASGSGGGAGSPSAGSDGGPDGSGYPVDGGDAEGPSEREAVVTIAQGTAIGSVDGETRVFLGIPYAAPPVGELRFAPPRAAEPWTGTLNATQSAAACPQPMSGLAQSEDCLTLNVYAPRETPAQGVPVLVFIHGGSGNSGSASEYDGRWLSDAGEIVVVTMNYRLGTLAWFMHPDLEAESGTTPGNLGIRDQQQALRWVQQNIAAFGGDPSMVTLVGESHGAMATCLHMFATGSEALAHRYIMQSGGCVGSAVGPGTREGMVAKSEALAASLCPGSTDVVACMRQLDAATIAAAATTRVPLEDAQGPYVDGELFVARPHELLAAGNYRHAPILLGSNLHETNFLASDHFGGPDDWPLAENSLELTIALAFMYPDDWPAALEHYGAPATDAEANGVMVSIMDDSWMRCPARRLAEGAATHGDAVYYYSFELLPAVHTLELDYVFGDPSAPFSRLFEGAPVPPVAHVVDIIQGYWARFAKTGDPNGDGAPIWPTFTAAADRYVSLNEAVAQEQGHIKDHCDFWATTVIGSR